MYLFCFLSDRIKIFNLFSIRHAHVACRTLVPRFGAFSTTSFNYRWRHQHAPLVVPFNTVNFGTVVSFCNQDQKRINKDHLDLFLTAANVLSTVTYQCHFVRVVAMAIQSGLDGSTGAIWNDTIRVASCGLRKYVFLMYWLPMEARCGSMMRAHRRAHRLAADADSSG